MSSNDHSIQCGLLWTLVSIIACCEIIHHILFSLVKFVLLFIFRCTALDKQILTAQCSFKVFFIVFFRIVYCKFETLIKIWLYLLQITTLTTTMLLPKSDKICSVVNTKRSTNNLVIYKVKI